MGIGDKWTDTAEDEYLDSSDIMMHVNSFTMAVYKRRPSALVTFPDHHSKSAFLPFFEISIGFPFRYEVDLPLGICVIDRLRLVGLYCV